MKHHDIYWIWQLIRFYRTKLISILIFLFSSSPRQAVDIAELMLDFIEWLTSQEFGRQCILSIRDVLSWINFMNTMAEDRQTDSSEQNQTFSISPLLSFVHAACLVYIDGIGSGMCSNFNSWQNIIQ